jgi:hypothetical protein
MGIRESGDDLIGGRGVIVGLLDVGDGEGSDAFSTAGEAEHFVGGGLYADATGRDAEGGGDVFAHGGDVGGHLWRLGDDGGIDIDDAGVLGGEDEGDALEDLDGADAANGFVGIREMVADVAFANGTECGIGDGVAEGVGVGMAIEAGIVRYIDAAEDEFAAANEAVDVVADA